MKNLYHGLDESKSSYEEHSEESKGQPWTAAFIIVFVVLAAIGIFFYLCPCTQSKSYDVHHDKPVGIILDVKPVDSQHIELITDKRHVMVYLTHHCYAVGDTLMGIYCKNNNLKYVYNCDHSQKVSVVEEQQ